MKNELYSFATVASPSFGPSLLASVAPCALTSVTMPASKINPRLKPLSANIVGGEAGRGGAYLENPRPTIETTTPFRTRNSQNQNFPTRSPGGRALALPTSHN